MAFLSADENRFAGLASKPGDLARRAPGHVSQTLIADSLVAVEVAGIAFAAVVAEEFYEQFFYLSELKAQEYIFPGIACAALFLQMLRSRGLLGFRAQSQGLKNWRGLGLALAHAFLILCATAFALKVSSDYSRGWLLVWISLSALWLVLTRTCMGRLAKWLTMAGRLDRRVHIIRAKGASHRILAAFDHQPGIQVVGQTEIAPQDLERTYLDADDILPISDLIEGRDRQEVGEVIISIGGFSNDNLRRLLDELAILSVPIWLHWPTPDLELPIQGVDQIGHIHLIKARRTPIDGWGYVAKRVLDLGVATLAIAALSPLLLLIAVSIKLDSRGPVIFRQRRHGYNEREIVVFKFRTMTTTDDGPVVRQAQKNDSRITRVGRILRSTSLDELPQLFNVVLGEMSLVGPRPHALAHNNYYRSRVQSYACRHRVKPGITGLAQINGFRGLIDTPDKMENRVKMDLRYIETWSFWLDLKILILTPIFGFISKNAF